MFCYQRNGFGCRIKCSVLHLGLWVHKRFLCITIPTLYDRLGHTLFKGLLEPNFWVQGPLICDCDSLYDDISDGMFHDPHSCERSCRVFPKNFDRRISKNYLVRREMACRERRTRPPALPRRPKASAVSLPPICESQLGDNS